MVLVLRNFQYHNFSISFDLGIIDVLLVTLVIDDLVGRLVSRLVPFFAVVGLTAHAQII